MMTWNERQNLEFNLMMGHMVKDAYASKRIDQLKQATKTLVEMYEKSGIQWEDDNVRLIESIEKL